MLVLHCLLVQLLAVHPVWVVVVSLALQMLLVQDKVLGCPQD